MDGSGKRRKGCSKCGYGHPYKQCPAFRKRCSNCQEYNHFARVCPEKQNQSDGESSYYNERHTSDDYGSEYSDDQSSIASSASAYGNSVRLIAGCYNCGLSHPRSRCPAYGTKCSACNKMNHFAQVCFSKAHNKENSTPVVNPPRYQPPTNYYSDSSSEDSYNQSPYVHAPAAGSSKPSTSAAPKYANDPRGAIPKKPLNERGQINCPLPVCSQKHDTSYRLDKCGHTFFRNCLAKQILASDGTMKCPSLKPCDFIITLPVIEKILTPIELELYQSTEQTFQCKTKGCRGYCTYRKEPMFFHCPVCTKVNCLLCKNIHSQGPCKALEDILNYPNENNTKTLKERKENLKKLYPVLLDLYKLELVLFPEKFQCTICFEDYEPMEGIILKQCLHVFCRSCLHKTIVLSGDTEIKCPFIDDSYSCDNCLLEYEIRALLSDVEYEKRLDRTLESAKHKINSFQCLTPGCKGWCEIVEDAEEFDCPICFETNCIICRVIHGDMTCEEYQNSRFAAMSEAEIESLVNRHRAMRCPNCSAVITKIDGCDGITCPMCRLDICWVTKRPRWGPRGKGDWTGGCQCGLNGRKCHPNCGNCH